MKKTCILIMTIGTAAMLCTGCGNKNTSNTIVPEKTGVIQDGPEDTEPEQVRTFVEITEINGNTILVKPEDGSWELNSSNAFAIPKDRISDDIKPEVGMWLEVIYNGSINETYPAGFSGIASISVAEYPGRRDADTPDETVDEDRAAVGGPYGELSVILPQTWTAETAPIDSNKLMYGLYGLIIKPVGVSEGRIELFCSDRFGVCGTDRYL